MVRVDTVRRPEFRPNYFFGDTFGVLPCRQCSRWRVVLCGVTYRFACAHRACRSLETIEASITFGEEREEVAESGETLVSFTHSITPHYDFVKEEAGEETNNDVSLRVEVEEVSEDLYMPGVKDTLTKDQIVEIFCSN